MYSSLEPFCKAEQLGYPHLTRLLNATKFPWLLSNIVDETTGKQPEKFLKYWVTERCGVKIGVIGLVEQSVSALHSQKRR